MESAGTTILDNKKEMVSAIEVNQESENVKYQLLYNEAPVPGWEKRAKIRARISHDG